MNGDKGMFDNNAEKVNLSGEATRSTMGSIASGLGWLALLVLALATAGHAVSITPPNAGCRV